MSYKLYNGDCLEVMKEVSDNSVDLVLCDLPYNKTACEWDKLIPPDLLWEQYNRITKTNAPVILFGSQPFTSLLVTSNLKNFKQELIWSKGKGSDPMLAKKRIMSAHESILLFCRGSMPYNPQMRVGAPYKAPRTGGNRTNRITGTKSDKVGFKQQDNSGFRYPISVLDFSIHCGSKLHPTQKPIQLLEYLIRTYSKEGSIVLDNTAGSFSTCDACVNTGRSFIGIEKDVQMFNSSVDRLRSKYASQFAEFSVSCNNECVNVVCPNIPT